jgi:hypothetical protein
VLEGLRAGVLPLAACELLCNALPAADALDAALAVLNQAREITLGAGLLTVNRNATDTGDPVGELRLQRLWSSEPATYPVGGAKRKTRTAWTRQLLEEGQLFVGEGDAALATVFDDHATIFLLGLHAVVNVPIKRAGRCVATFNVLGARPSWQPHEVSAVRLLALLATPWVLEAIAAPDSHGDGP